MNAAPPNRPRYVLLDRDGTIVVDRGYLGDPAGVELLPGAATGLRRMRLTGLRLVIVTNQSGVARGYFDEAAMHAVNERTRAVLLEHGIDLAGVYSCVDGPDSDSHHRKPKPGMVEDAAAELGFDPREAFVIGDKPSDVNLAKAVGATAILVRTGEGAATEAAGACEPDLVVDDLVAAAEAIRDRLVGDLAATA